LAHLHAEGLDVDFAPLYDQPEPTAAISSRSMIKVPSGGEPFTPPPLPRPQSRSAPQPRSTQAAAPKPTAVPTVAASTPGHAWSDLIAASANAMTEAAAAQEVFLRLNQNLTAGLTRAMAFQHELLAQSTNTPHQQREAHPTTLPSAPPVP